MNIKRDTWVNAKIRVTKSGKIQAVVPASAVRVPNGAGDGFIDANGVYHPIRASASYDPGRTQEGMSISAKRRYTAKKKKKTASTRKAAKRKTTKRKR